MDANALIDELNPAEALEPFSQLTVPGAAPSDASDFMLTERLAAWTKLFLADQIDDPLLMTTSLPVFTDLVDHSGAARLLLQLNASEWPESGESSGCRHQVENRPTAKAPDRDDNDADLAIYLMPDIHLRSYLAELAGGSYSDRIHHRAAGDRVQNVAVALLNPGRFGKLQSGLPRQE